MIKQLKKNTEATTNKMRIPLTFVKKFGRNYLMEIHEDKLIIIPFKKGE